MCSICGLFAPRKITPEKIDAVRRMGETMRSRGPDRAGSYADADTAFHHNRLAVMGRYIAGYNTSSNRLAFAIFAIDNPGCVRSDKRHFTSVTNQLLSSGQPLVQLNIGEVGD